MFSASIMMGAQDRLLPPSLPYGFFASAVAFHIIAWAALMAGAGDSPRFSGGLGLPLAGLHLMTLGVLTMTAMGAAFQMLPVATRKRLGPLWACRLTWWLFTPGVPVLAVGLGWGWGWALYVGGGLVLLALTVFGILVARNLAQVKDLPAMTRHVWLSMLCLAALAVLAFSLVADFTQGFLPSHADVSAAHAILAGYGFMGMLALGFSSILIPMFVLASAPPDEMGRRSAALSALALILGAGGAVSGHGAVAALGGIVGLGAMGQHGFAMRHVLQKRMRKRLEPFFRLTYAAWVLAPLGLIVGIAALLGIMPQITVPLWGWLLVYGWLLSFVTAILQRIMPFLASMHSGGGGLSPALPSRLTATLPLDAHTYCHYAALALVSAGIIANSPLLTRAGTFFGFVGAVSFAVFAVEVGRRFCKHQSQTAEPIT